MIAKPKLSRDRMFLCALVLAVLVVKSTTQADELKDLAVAYKTDVQPLLKQFCFECHSGDTLEAEIDLATFSDLTQIRPHVKDWQKISEMLSSEQMPPPDSKELPSDTVRAKMLTWVRSYLTIEAQANAGDPGPVVLRRLSNAEYTYTLRDLTGISTLDSAKEFPADSASGEGFTNVGNSLVMSPSLLTKYLDAAKQVASHAVLLPDGIRFSPYKTRRDWTNESLARIRGFYARFCADGGGSTVNLQGIQFSTNSGGRLPVERYLLATIEERGPLSLGAKSIEAVARERELSPKYLGTLWTMLNSSDNSLLLSQLQTKWKNAQAGELAQLVNQISNWQTILFKFNSVGQIGLHPEIKSWLAPVRPLLTRQNFRVKLPSDANGDVVLSLRADAGDGNTRDVEFVVSGYLHSETGNDGSVRLAGQAGSTDAELPTKIPFITDKDGPVRQRIDAAFNDFRNLFPPTLCYTQIVPVDEVVTLLIYYREDDQLQRLMLTDEQSAQLDRMWDEHFFISHEPLEMVTTFTQLYQFATQDRADLLPAFEPLRQPVKDNAAAFNQRLIDSEPKQLDAVIDFAAKAYRRPLTDEARELRDLYARLRSEELGHDEALRLTLARILVSPTFLYHIETPGPGTKATQVSDYELASRLSYFLWSTGPDDELLSLAAAGKLQDSITLAGQAKRMLKDAKVRRLAIEFGTHWLHIHDFDQLNEKSERHFPTFAALRTAMYEESLLVLTDVFQKNRSLMSLVDGDATFLNEELAQHYNIPGVVGPDWRRVEGVRQYSRGSILSLATTLSMQSGASRTSPILRGTWLSEVMLGEKLPKPPKNVPLLAETVTEGLTEREMTHLHSNNAACAKCHTRIDPFGFALEGFDAIGRLRITDAAGLPIDTKTVLFDGTKIDGLGELKAYLGDTRRDAFIRQFTKKLLGYSLGRAVQLSDEPLLNEMQKQLAQSEFQVGTAIKAIVVSPQFREIRGREMAIDE